jgi:type IV pilus assembly protein PilQ
MNKMNGLLGLRMKIKIRLTQRLQVILFAACLSLSLLSQAEDQLDLSNHIESIRFNSLPSGNVAIKLKTTSPMSQAPKGFLLQNPARIALDFPLVGSSLASDYIVVKQGVLKSISVAQAKTRTRMVLNLTEAISYTTSVDKNEVTILLQDKDSNTTMPTNSVRSTVSPSLAFKEKQFAEPTLDKTLTTINQVNFVRGKNGEGRIVVDLSDASANVDIKQKGGKIQLLFSNTSVANNLQRRMNVTNFNTPVVYVDTFNSGNNTLITIEPKGQWEQSAYQTDKRFTLDVREIVADPNKMAGGSKPGYSGEKLSLNFQNIEVRSVLQVIADFTGLNIITSDSVSGNLTLRLKDVPWDQALDIITQSKGLAMRKNGNVILVAPADEIATKEKQALEATQQMADLEPVRTEVFTLKYMKAEALKDLLSDPKQKILSKRGSVVLDARTNTVFVQDTPKFLEQVQSIINKTDVAVRQVMIESRLVIADDTYSRMLGARFGVTKTNTSGSSTNTVSGTLGNRFTESADGTLTQGLHNGSIQTATGGGQVLTSADGQPDLMSNLPVANAFGSFAYTLYQLSAGVLLNLELSAMESDNRGKVISSPRVTTANQHKAKIASGTEIPYLEASASGAATIAFKSATLSLEVTPQITPDDKIIMELDVKKDSVGTVFNGVPSIQTQNINTQVLVGNGETAVLGGIYEQTARDDVDRVPFFGTLPVVGNLFKRTNKQNDKTELLIFITPKILDEKLSLR